MSESLTNQDLLEILKRRGLTGLYVAEEIPAGDNKKVNDLLDQQDQLLEYLEDKC